MRSGKKFLNNTYSFFGFRANVFCPSGTDSGDTASQFNRRSSYYAGMHKPVYTFFPLFRFWVCGGKAQLKSFSMDTMGRALLVLSA